MRLRGVAGAAGLALAMTLSGACVSEDLSGAAGSAGQTGSGGSGADTGGSGGANAAGGTSGTGGTSCDPISTTYEAESMSSTTGEATTDGWNIWANGSVYTEHTFEGGPATISVTARGDVALDEWPHMVVEVGAAQIGEATVDSASYEQHDSSFDAAPGRAEIRITFDNDFSGGGQDRNLVVDKVLVTEECGGASGTGGAGGAAGAAGAAGSGGAGGSGGSGGGTGGSGGSGGGTGGSGGSGPVFDTCRFQFGLDHARYRDDPLAEVDYVSAWAGSGESFNLGSMFQDLLPGGPAAGKLPVVYGYIIAFTARRDEGLCDCNVTCNTSSENLCTAGARYIRDHFDDRIVPQYEKYAQGIRNVYGTDNPVIWLMEPDYYQYATPSSQSGNPLTFAQAGDYMRRIVAAVRAILPNALFSLDISPWMSQTAFNQWIGNFEMSDFTFMNTSGGATRADIPNIRQGQLTWEFVRQATQKPIIADASYCGGSGCNPQAHDARWDDAANLNARIADGVVAITHVNVPSGYNATIAALRSQLSTPATCP